MLGRECGVEPGKGVWRGGACLSWVNKAGSRLYSGVDSRVPHLRSSRGGRCTDSYRLWHGDLTCVGLGE